MTPETLRQRRRERAIVSERIALAAKEEAIRLEWHQAVSVYNDRQYDLIIQHEADKRRARKIVSVYICVIGLIAVALLL